MFCPAGNSSYCLINYPFSWASLLIPGLLLAGGVSGVILRTVQSSALLLDFCIFIVVF